MSDLPPPDLMAQSGRARRLFLALLAAGAVAASVYGITYKMSDPDHQATTGGFKFVFYMTGFAFVAVFIVVIKVLNWRADKKYRAQLVAQAKVVK
jgi:putative solute:sodium symporter small subunit